MRNYDAFQNILNDNPTDRLTNQPTEQGQTGSSFALPKKMTILISLQNQLLKSFNTLHRMFCKGNGCSKLIARSISLPMTSPRAESLATMNKFCSDEVICQTNILQETRFHIFQSFEWRILGNFKKRRNQKQKKNPLSVYNFQCCLLDDTNVISMVMLVIIMMPDCRSTKATEDILRKRVQRLRLDAIMHCFWCRIEPSFLHISYI